MSTPVNPPIETTVGYNRVHALWIDGTGIWTNDYFPHPDTATEEIQYERRRRILSQAFRTYKLFEPTIELLDTAALGQSQSSKIGAQLLRVTTYVMPHVDEKYFRPVVELRQPAPSAEWVEKSLVLRDLNAGGLAIYNTFASAMTPRQ